MTVTAEFPRVMTVDWAVVPRVDLLPPEIAEARHFRQVRRWAAAAVAVTVLLIAAAFASTLSAVSTAQAQEARAQRDTAVLVAQETRYADIPRRLKILDTARAAREKALSRDLPWYRLLTDLALNSPPGVTMTTVDLSVTPAAAAPASTVVSPLTPDGLGRVDIGAAAKSFADVTAWMSGVANVRGLTGVTLRSASRGADPTGMIQFTAGVTITPDVLSHRYDRKAG